MTIQNDTLSHPILSPLNYEKSDAAEKNLPEKRDIERSNGDTAKHNNSPPRKKSIRRFLAFLKSKTRPRIPATKIESLQAQEQRERVELLDENYTIAYDAVACLLVLMALAALNLRWDSAVVKMAFIFPLITAPLTVVQRRRINKASWLREDVTCLLAQLERRRQQNQRLQEQNDQLELRLTSLKEREREFHSFLRKQGASTKQVLRLVRENGEIKRKVAQLEESKKLLLLVESVVKSSTQKEGLETDGEEFDKIQQLLQSMPRATTKGQKSRMAVNTSGSIVISAVGTDPSEEISEYEYFTFPRRPSIE